MFAREVARLIGRQVNAGMIIFVPGRGVGWAGASTRCSVSLVRGVEAVSLKTNAKLFNSTRAVLELLSRSMVNRMQWMLVECDFRRGFSCISWYG